MGGPHLTAVLAAVLARLIDVNEKSAGAGAGPVTKFHAQRAPSISVAAYLERIRRFSNCSDECFVIALIYIDRLIESKNFVLSHLNVHRVVITSVLVAAKFFDDHFYNNAYYARVGGVPSTEMNSLEVEFLMCMNYSLFVNEDTYDKYRRELTNYAHSAIVPQKTPTQFGDVYAPEHEPMQQQLQQHEQQEPMAYSSPHAQGYFMQNDQQHQRPIPLQADHGHGHGHSNGHNHGHGNSHHHGHSSGYDAGNFQAAAPQSWNFPFHGYGEPMPGFGGNGFGHDVQSHSHFMQMPMHSQPTHDASYSANHDGPVFMMHAAPPLYHQHAFPFGAPQLPYGGMPGAAVYPAFYIPVGTR